MAISMLEHFDKMASKVGRYVVFNVNLVTTLNMLCVYSIKLSLVHLFLLLNVSNTYNKFYYIEHRTEVTFKTMYLTCQKCSKRPKR